MRTRRAARERALQALYQLDIRKDEGGGRDLGLFWSHFEGEGGQRAAETETFARALVEGVALNRERIDALIAESAEHWRLPRLSRVDLNLLRLATFELLGRPEIPTAVTINEAVEIARRFGSDESAAFVNGVLDHIAGLLGVRDKAGDAG
jgi:transcription antitermination protein NusB